MAGAAKTAYSSDRRAAATEPGRPRHPVAGAAWLAVMPAGAITVVLTRFSPRGGAARHTTVVPTIANITDGRWAYQPVRRMPHSPALTAQHMAAIDALVRRHDYAGADIHYEDFVLTCAVALLGRQPRLLPLAVFFPFMRMLDAAISLYSVPAAWLLASNGRWDSPARRPVARAAPAPLPAAGRPAGGSHHSGTRNEPGKPARVAEASHVSG